MGRQRKIAAKLNRNIPAKPTPRPRTPPAALVPDIDEPSAVVVSKILLTFVEARYPLTTRIADIIDDLRSSTIGFIEGYFGLMVGVDLGDEIQWEPRPNNGATTLGDLVPLSAPESDHISVVLTFIPETDKVTKPIQQNIETLAEVLRKEGSAHSDTVRLLKGTERELADAKDKLSVAQADAIDQKSAIDMATTQLNSLSRRMPGKKVKAKKSGALALNDAIETLADRFCARMEAMEAMEARMEASMMALKADNATMKEENATMKAENATMKAENATMREEYTAKMKEQDATITELRKEVGTINTEFIYPIRRRKLLDLARDDFYDRINDDDLWERNFAAHSLATLIATELEDQPRLPALTTLDWLFDSRNQVRTDGNDAAHHGDKAVIAEAILKLPAASKDRQHLEKVFMYKFEVDEVR